MQIQIAFRHMESSDAIKDYVNKKLDRLDRFGEFLLDVNVTLAQEHHRAQAEFVAAVKGDTLRCKEDADDMYASIDGGVATLERMVRRYQEQLRGR